MYQLTGDGRATWEWFSKASSNRTKRPLDLGADPFTHEAEILKFVQQMKPRDHAILFYSRPEHKHQVLFTYLEAGLDHGEAAAYVASQESPDEVRQAMKRLGIKVDRFERSGALHVIRHEDWYIIDGKFSISKTTELWKKLYDESIAKGFRGLRVAGEMDRFLKNGMVQQLLEYERSLHRVLELPITAICSYDSGCDKGLSTDLIEVHSHAIILGPESGVVSS